MPEAALLRTRLLHPQVVRTTLKKTLEESIPASLTRVYTTMLRSDKRPSPEFAKRGFAGAVLNVAR